MIILIIALLALVSFILAYRSLGELDPPTGIVTQIKRSVSRVKKWGIVIFSKGQKIEYTGEESKETNESENPES